MREVEQAPGQDVLEHGVSVFRKFIAITDALNGVANDVVLPRWATAYKDSLLDALPSPEAWTSYLIWHDCGKPLVREVDAAGKVHYPRHEYASEQQWRDVGGSEAVASFMRDDMLMHRMTAEEAQACSLDRGRVAMLLLSCLAELHANAEMFGGRESESFKIKMKRLSKRGDVLCKRVFS